MSKGFLEIGIVFKVERRSISAAVAAWVTATSSPLRMTARRS
jgi:hypothetical protein